MAQNAPPIADAGDPQTVASGELVILDGRRSIDPDGTIASYQWIRLTRCDNPSVPVVLSNGSTAQPSFTAPALAPGVADMILCYLLRLTDDDGARSPTGGASGDTDTVTITVTAPFADPVADAGDPQTVAPGATVTLDGSGSTHDRRRTILSWAWTRTGGTGGPVTLSDASAEQPTFTADTLAPGVADVTHTFTLTVTDDKGATDTDTVMVTVAIPNKPPVADAGDPQTVASGELVILDGRRSIDPDGTIASYQWIRLTRCDNPPVPVVLSNGSTAQPSFTAPALAPGVADMILCYLLRLTDDDGARSPTGGASGDTDTVTITVTAPFADPVADAGDPQTVAPGATVTLDGSGSTHDRRRTILSWAWTRTGGTGGPVTLSDASAEQPTFTADTLAPGVADVTHTFTLTVTDDKGATDTDTVMVTVAIPNKPPVADAGDPQTVASGELVILDGRRSIDPDGTIASYQWIRLTRCDNPSVPVVLSNGSTAQPSFTAPALAPGVADMILCYLLRLTDDDGARSPTGGASGDTDTVTITVTAPFADPVADAGDPQTVAPGATVTLDGSGSTHDRRRTILSWAWTRTGGTGGPVTLSDASAEQPTFTADTLAPGVADVTHTFTLTVTDDKGATDTDTVMVTVAIPNKPPVADAGDPQTVASGELVILDGRRSIDPDGTIASYQWIRLTRCDNPSVPVVLSNGSTAQPSFTAPALAPGVADMILCYLLRLTDDDGARSPTGGASGDTDTVTITVTAPFADPVADAGDPQTVAPGATVTLDGSGSTHDRRRTILSWAWTRTGGTGGPVTLSDASAEQPTFTADTLAPGVADVTHTFTLTVTDDKGATDTDTVMVTVAIPNKPPVADAGDPQTVASGELVILDGRRSIDPDGTIASYQWIRLTRCDNPPVPVVLSNGSTAQPSFTAPALAPGVADMILCYLLRLTDDDGARSPTGGASGDTDTVTITVTAPFADPVADAGDPQTVAPGATVTLDGSGSTHDRRRTITSYAWTRTSGTGGSLSDADKAMARFTAPALTPGAPDAPHVFELTVTDDAGDSETDTVTITVTSPFAPVVADAGDDQSVASGATVTLDGSGSTHDRRFPIELYEWERTGGTTGGSVTLSDENAAKPTFTADALTNGASSVKHIFTLTVTDSDGETDTDTVTVVVVAPNPTDMVAPTVEFREVPASHDGESAFHVELKFSEPVIGSLTEVIFGSFLSAPSGTLGPLATNLVQDPNDPTLYTVTITPRAPYSFFLVLSTLGEGGVLLVTDAGGNGITGSTNSGQIRYVPPKRPPEADAGDDRVVFSGETVRLDASRTSDFDDLVVKWLWENTGDGTSTARPTITNADKEQASFVAETLTAGADDVTHIIKLTVTDQAGNTDTDEVTITVEAPDAVPNVAPVANAGPDQDGVRPGTTVTLDGSSSRDDDGTITYAWTRTSGSGDPTVMLSDTTAIKPTFTADTLTPGDDDVTHIFTLTVTDNNDVADTDTVTITVEAPAATLEADAGEDSELRSGATVTLDGSGSMPGQGRTIASYNWARTSGTGGSLTDADKAMARFTAPALTPDTPDETHVFELTVTDDAGDTDTDTVTITVEAPNADPVAEAGPEQRLVRGDTVTLDGSGSMDPDALTGETLKYSWLRATGADEGSGDPVILSDPAIAGPTFTAETPDAGAADDTYGFTLTVTDVDEASHADTVTITVNAPPKAHAGPDRTYGSAAPVTLDGSGSSDTTGTFTYAWARTEGADSGDAAAVTLAGANTASPTFTAETLASGAPDVSYGFTLTVTDADGIEATNTVKITVTSGNVPPVAEAGPNQRLKTGGTVTLDGSGSMDPDALAGETLTYGWLRATGADEGSGDPVTLSNPAIAGPTFTAETPDAGAADDTYGFTLTVTDADSESHADQVKITVNAPPKADAGDDLIQDSGTLVTLDGSGSSDTTGTFTHAWVRTTGDTVTLSDSTAAEPTFTAPVLEAGDADAEYVFTLTVTDADGVTDEDTVMVTINAPAFAALVAQAGPDQDNVASGAPVMLDGTGSTRTGGGRNVTYLWARTGGTQGGSVTLTGDTTLAPSFTADTLTAGDDDVEHIITLTVMDNQGTPAATDTVTITVKAPGFTALVAQAGPDQDNVASGAPVTLDGTGSTRTGGGRNVTYLWARTGGTQGGSVTLTGDTTLAPSFTADTLAEGADDVTHVFTLTVTDNQGSPEATDMVTVTIEAPDDTTAPTGVIKPVAATHDGMTAITMTVDFDEPVTGFVASDITATIALPAGFPLETHEPTITNFAEDTNDASLYTFTLTPRAPLQISLSVAAAAFSDEAGNPGEVDLSGQVNYTGANAAPIADAGPDQEVAPGETVTLDGRDSRDIDGSIKSYAWFHGGTGQPELTGGTTARPSFTAPDVAPGAADRVLSYGLSVTDNQDRAGDRTDTVRITVIAPIAPTVAEAGPNQTVASGALVELDGSGSTSDRRFPIGENDYAWQRTGGTMGVTAPTLTGATTATPTFTAETLMVGDTDVTHIFTLTVTDSDGDSAEDMVTITVEAPNADPVAEAGPNQRRVTGGTVTLDGSGSMDPDGTPGEMLTYGWARSDSPDRGNGGMVALSDSTIAGPTFTAVTPDAGAADATYGFTLTVTDVDEATHKDMVTITVNAPPKANAGSDQVVAPAATVTLKGGDSSDTTGMFTYAWARTTGADSGDAAAVTLAGANTASPTFTAETLASGAADVTYDFTLTVTDADGIEATDTVMVTVTTGDLPPVADAGPNQRLVTGGTVTLDGSGSMDPDGTPGEMLTYGWVRATGADEGSGDPVILSNPAIAGPTFTAETPEAGEVDDTYGFTLTVTDAQGETAKDTVKITINAPPKAEAGDDLIQDSGTLVTLDGSGSSDTTGTFTHAWVRTTGGAVTLSDSTAAQPTFTAPVLEAGDADAEYVFTLTVTDADGVTATDTVMVTINAPPFADLVAEAGPDQDNVASGTLVTLTGTGSTPTGSGRDVTYLWARTGGTTGGTVTLADDTTLAPSFTADTLTAGDDDVEHIITLTVMDNQGTPQATDTVTITVKAPAFPALVAEAGPDQDNVASGTLVTLTGTGSTPTGSGRDVTYLWARTGGTTGGTVTLADDTTLAPSFTADTLTAGDDEVEHIITLTVMDNQGTPQATDTVTITVKAPAFPALVAQAGPDQDNVASGTLVTLTGTGSTPTGSGRDVTYLWARTGGTTGGTVTLADDTTLAPSFTADTLTAGDDEVEHIITLTVMDNQGTPQATDTVTITVKAPAFPALVAQAGPDQDNVASGTKATLTGTGSTLTGSGRDVTYLWARTGGTQGGTVTLADDTTLAPSFTADTLNPGDDDVEHIITLTVMDNQGSTDATDTVTITVKAPGFPALVAQAGPDQDNVASGTKVTLTGTGSTLTGSGRDVTYLWARTGGTQGGTVTLADDTTLAPSFTADTLNPGDDDVEHIITLTVMDDRNSTDATDTVTITVTSGFADPLAIIAGGDRSVASGATVQLDGSGSTHDSRTTLTYGWERTGGTGDSNLTLTGANTSQPTFTAETLTPGATAVTHILTLTVTDSEGGTDTATVTITVTSVVIKVDGSEPVGPIPVISGETVTLDGSGTDIDGTIKSWLWERIGGTGDRSDVTLSGLNTATLSVTANRADTAQTSFVADTCTSDPGGLTHIFTLTVTDNDDVTSTSAPVTVIVSCVAQVEVDISLSRSELMVQEGGSGTYQVRLGESPPQEVTIMATSGNEAVVQLKNARLVFNAGNWNDWQAVEINTVAGSSTDDPVVIRHRLVTDGVTSAVPGDVTVTLRARADDPIPAPVGQFLQTRATALINNQPGLSSLLELDGSTPGGGGGGSFTFQATDGRLAMNGGFVHNSVWGKVSGAYASSESAGGTTRSVTKSVLASFGVHRKYSEHVLAGAMLQFDLSDHDRAGQVGRTDTIDGTGWLVGPYFAVRHGSQPLYFEVRLLYGQSDNDIRFMDTGLGVMRTGSFDTRRLLAQIRVEGEIAMSGRGTGEDGGAEGPRLRPYADVRWIEDRANAFTDNVNNRVPGQTVSIGQLELGSNVEIPIAVRTGAMTFTGGLGLVWSNTEGDYINSESRSHGRGEIGFSYDLDDNLRIDLDSFYDGIGTSRYEGYGLSLSAEMKF